MNFICDLRVKMSHDPICRVRDFDRKARKRKWEMGSFFDEILIGLKNMRRLIMQNSMRNEVVSA